MTSTNFTFLNATGTPALSQSDAKLMRAHITRKNFATRRERIIEDRTAASKRATMKKVALMRIGQVLLMQNSPNFHSVSVDNPLLTAPKDPICYTQYLCRFWSLVFLGGDTYPSSPDEEAWIQLLVSETALAEISIGIGIRHLSPDDSFQQKALVHSSNAASIIVERIKCGTAHSAAIIGAVVSMAIEAREMHNEPIWNIHVQGLAHLITERLSQGKCYLPSVLSTFLILDSTNAVFGSPLVYHRKVIDAIRAYDNQPICEVANISDSLVQLRKQIDTYRKYPSGSDCQQEDIKESWNSLLLQARALRSEHNLFILATSLAIELILFLLWFPQLQANTELLAGELKEAMCQFPFRPCVYMDLTSCQLILGAVAAADGSQVKAWFVARLRKAALALRSRGWVQPFESLEKSFVSDARLAARFRALWKDLDA